MGLYGTVTDRQTQPCALPDTLGRKEWVKNLLQVLFVDPATRVFYDNLSHRDRAGFGINTGAIVSHPCPDAYCTPAINRVLRKHYVKVWSARIERKRKRSRQRQQQQRQLPQKWTGSSRSNDNSVIRYIQDD